ncbi:MAG: FtsX-like permease family protein [Acidimicrobiia bacterium]
MTLVQDLPTADKDNGGGPARRAVIRWALRLYRREWRQQALVLALLTVAVAASIFSASSAYNIAPVPGNSEFGTVNHYLKFDGSDPQALAAALSAAEEYFGTIEVIAHRQAPVSGSVESIEIRAQDPQGPFSAPMLALLEGRYPAGAGEVGVTDGVADTFQLSIGTSFTLDGAERIVVGLVENPSDLRADFVLMDPSHIGPPEQVTILVDAGNDMVFGFRTDNMLARSQRPANTGALAAAGVLGAATVALLLVALIAVASFVVVAQRRLRQLGMLAAIGATEKNLRLVTVANGAAIGSIAAVIGALTGLVGWTAAVPLLEPGVGHRIERFNVPWWLIGTGMLLAVVAATAAAWWPARAVARIPITLALSGRPPRPTPAHRSAALAGVLIVAGIACLLLAGQANTLLIGSGTVAIILGVLLIGPFAIQALAVTARRLPIAVRLALRDLSRYQARSGAALAAISLVLGIPVAIVVIATAATAADKGNLSDSQILIWTREPDAPEGVSPFFTMDPGDSGFSPFIPEWTPAEVGNLEAQVDRIAATLDEPMVTALDVAMDPTLDLDPRFGRYAVSLARRNGERWLDVALLYLPTPELLGHHGIGPDAVEGDAEVLTVETDELRFLGTSREQGAGPEAVTSFATIAPGYSSLPGSFITPEALRQRGWEPARVGWLIETNAPLTSEELAAARFLAADAGMLIESRDQQEGLLTLRWGATAVGTLLALGVLAMTVGLIRSATGADLRTLTATGATSTTRRTLTATTAGALALLGALLGTVGAYVGLAAGYLNDLGTLSSIPVLHLSIIVVGLPLTAAIASWLLAGREPRSIARQPIE